jgi:transposase
MANLSTHKPKRDHWIKRHPDVRFHFTPTHASWLNQIEIWYSLLSRYALRSASFTGVRQLRQAINDFISAHNEMAASFEWTKRYVKSVHLKNKYACLYK